MFFYGKIFIGIIVMLRIDKVLVIWNEKKNWSWKILGVFREI